jgi:hypothetical protein
MVEENVIFVNSDKENGGEENEENGRRIFINLYPGKKTQLLNQAFSNRRIKYIFRLPLR